jgi:hypothetical protein
MAWTETTLPLPLRVRSLFAPCVFMMQYQLSAGTTLLCIRHTTRLCKPGTAVSLVQTSIRGSHPINWTFWKVMSLTSTGVSHVVSGT